jgi:hypothetical protein
VSLPDDHGPDRDLPLRKRDFREGDRFP